MVQYGYYPQQVMVYMGMGVVWENLTHGLPILNPRHMWVHELLHGNPRCIKDQLGMEKHLFRQLVRKLITLTLIIRSS